MATAAGTPDKTDRRRVAPFHPVLFAVYPVLPLFGNNVGLAYPSMSPVNNFRIVLSEVFGQDLPPLPDRSFYSPRNQLLELTEVTEQVPAAVHGAEPFVGEHAPKASATLGTRSSRG